MGAGVTTPNLNVVSIADSVLVNRNGQTSIQPMAKLAEQMNADLSISQDREAAQLASSYARKYATNPEDQEVVSGEYSALHHRLKTQATQVAVESYTR